MASFLHSVACPECGRTAVEDYYYRTGEGYIICSCCGCEVERIAKYDPEKKISYFEEEIRKGYGRFFLQKHDGSFKSKLFKSPLTEEQVESFWQEFSDVNTDQEKSYLVSYMNGIFTILFGNCPEEYDLTFEKYIEKYGYDFNEY